MERARFAFQNIPKILNTALAKEFHIQNTYDPRYSPEIVTTLYNYQYLLWLLGARNIVYLLLLNSVY